MEQKGQEKPAAQQGCRVGTLGPAQRAGAEARRPPGLAHSGFTPVALGAEENSCLMLESPLSSPQTGEVQGLANKEPGPLLAASNPAQPSPPASFAESRTLVSMGGRCPALHGRLRLEKTVHM